MSKKTKSSSKPEDKPAYEIQPLGGEPPLFRIIDNALNRYKIVSEKEASEFMREYMKAVEALEKEGKGKAKVEIQVHPKKDSDIPKFIKHIEAITGGKFKKVSKPAKKKKVNKPSKKKKVVKKRKRRSA